jgi:hypothetical protein
MLHTGSLVRKSSGLTTFFSTIRIPISNTMPLRRMHSFGKTMRQLRLAFL